MLRVMVLFLILMCGCSSTASCKLEFEKWFPDKSYHVGQVSQLTVFQLDDGRFFLCKRGEIKTVVRPMVQSSKDWIPSGVKEDK